MRCLDRAFGGGVAPGAGAGGADGADLEPVLGAAGQAGDGATRGFADVALRPRSAGRGGLLGDVGLDAAAEGVPGEIYGAFEVAAGGDEVGGLGELADGRAGGLQFPAAALKGGAVGGEGFGADRQRPRGSLGGGALVVARGEHLSSGLGRGEVSGVGGADKRVNEIGITSASGTANRVGADVHFIRAIPSMNDAGISGSTRATNGQDAPALLAGQRLDLAQDFP